MTSPTSPSLLVPMLPTLQWGPRDSMSQASRSLRSRLRRSAHESGTSPRRPSPLPVRGRAPRLREGRTDSASGVPVHAVRWRSGARPQDPMSAVQPRLLRELRASGEGDERRGSGSRLGALQGRRVRARSLRWVNSASSGGPPSEDDGAFHLPSVARLAVSARRLPLEQQAALAVPGARPHQQLNDA